MPLPLASWASMYEFSGALQHLVHRDLRSADEVLKFLVLDRFQPDQVARCRQAGLNAQVGLPIQISELMEAIARTASNKTGGEEPEAAGSVVN